MQQKIYFYNLIQNDLRSYNNYILSIYEIFVLLRCAQMFNSIRD